MREQRTGADLRTQLLPGMPVRTEVLRIDEQDKVRIPHIHHGAHNSPHTRKLNRPRNNARNAHLALNQINRLMSLDHTARSQTTVSSKSNLQLPFAAGEPGSNATSAITRELRLASICVEEPEKEFTIRLALEELDAI